MLAMVPEVEAGGVEPDGVDDRDGDKGQSPGIIVHLARVEAPLVHVDHVRSQSNEGLSGQRFTCGGQAEECRAR